MKRSFPASPRASRSGAFTIIELVVAIGVTALMVTLMLTITLNMLSGWNRSSGVLNTGNQARYILDQLVLDLQGAVLPRSTDAVFAATIQGNQAGDGDANATETEWDGRVKPPFGALADTDDSLLVDGTSEPERDISLYRFGQAGVWLRFFTSVSDNASTALANASAPRAVSYQILRRRRVSSAASPYSYQLFRSEVRPYGDNAGTQARSTFGIGYDLLADNFYNNQTGETTDDEDPARIRKPNLASLIGDGVIDFGVRAFVRDSTDSDGDGNRTELIEAFPVDRRVGPTAIRESFIAFTPTTALPNKVPLFGTTSGNPTPATSSYGYPVAVEVMVRILTPQGIQTIQSFEDDPTRFGINPPAGYNAKWWELATQYSNVYTRRINLPSEQ